MPVCPLCDHDVCRYFGRSNRGAWQCGRCALVFEIVVEPRAKTGLAFPIRAGSLAENEKGRDHAVGSGGSLDERFRLVGSKADAAAGKRP
jgi:hypothetical protein